MYTSTSIKGLLIRIKINVLNLWIYIKLKTVLLEYFSLLYPVR